MSLTDEQKRVKLAEAHGWERWKSQSGKVVLLKPRDEQERRCWIAAGDGLTSEPVNWWLVPDYLNDLNATHELEKVLTEDVQQREFGQALFRVATGEPYPGHRLVYPRDIFKCAHATAHQHAEALGRTLGLWS